MAVFDTIVFIPILYKLLMRSLKRWLPMNNLERIDYRMSEKTIKTRISNKYDKKVNWDQATFSPLKGELIIYSDGVDGQSDIPAVKIGDGVTPLGELPFVTTEVPIASGAGEYSIISNAITGNGANTADGNYSHVEGSGNEATENASCAHIEGAGNKGNAKYVHVQGWNNIGSGYGQDVMGMWNKEDPDKVAIVGWGDPNTKVRKNIYDLDKYGNARFGGSITLDMNGTPMTLTAEKLAKIIKFIDSIDGLSFSIQENGIITISTEEK